MDETSTHAGQVFVIGANHRSSSLAMRDRLFVEDRALPFVLGRLRKAGIRQAALLATCDRVEIQAVHADHALATQAVVSVLSEHGGVREEELRPQLYVLTGKDAVRHAFAVAASLDSQVIGESQVLGQVKAGHRLAREAGTCGPALDQLFQAAFNVAKRVRTETAIGEGPVSIAASAVQIARDLHGNLGRRSGLLIGVGEMGVVIAEGFVAGGLNDMTIIHTSEKRAEAVARQLDCHFADFDSLAEAMARADVVATAFGARRYVITVDMVMAALRRRRKRPIFFVDGGLPGDIDPAVNRIEQAFLYDLADLERVAMEGRANRETEARAAWRIVDDEVAHYLHGRAERAAVPALRRLRRHFEDVREAALADAGGDADRATRLLINRLLHGPSRAIKAIAAESGADPTGRPGDKPQDFEELEGMLDRLFGLNADDLQIEPNKKDEDS